MGGSAAPWGALSSHDGGFSAKVCEGRRKDGRHVPCRAVPLGTPGAVVSARVCGWVLPRAQSSVCSSSFASLMFSITAEKALKIAKMTGEIPMATQLKVRN